MTARWHGGGGAGFTLLELLVAITLMGLLASLLAGGLRFGTRVWHAGEDTLASLAQIQSVQALLRRQLTQALPLPAETTVDRAIVFEGEPDFVRFVGPAPSRLIAAGIYETILGLSYNDEAVQLVMAWRPVGTTEIEAEGADVAAEREQVVLVDDVADVAFAYFGAEENEDRPRWSDSWSGKTALPALVRVMVAFPEGDVRRWPELVVAPMVDLPAGQ